MRNANLAYHLTLAELKFPAFGAYILFYVCLGLKGIAKLSAMVLVTKKMNIACC